MGEQILCPACTHDHPDFDCACGCEYDTAFCGRCGWLDCECPPPPASLSAQTEEDGRG